MRRLCRCQASSVEIFRPARPSRDEVTAFEDLAPLKTVLQPVPHNEVWAQQYELINAASNAKPRDDGGEYGRLAAAAEGVHKRAR